MRRPRRRRARPAETAALERNGITPYLRHYLEHSAALGLSEQTLISRERALKRFIAWCGERGLQRPQDITRPVLERYRRHLFHYRKANGEPLGFATQAQRLIPLRTFFRWLAKENHILYNPASELTLPKVRRRLPQHRLTVEEVEQVLAQTLLHGPLGLRDRAILETFYATGIRRAELIQLTLYDIDHRYGTLFVHGKGNKDRVVPLGDRALHWIHRYLEEVRPDLVHEPDDGTLFVHEYGEPLYRNRLTDLVKRYLGAAGIEKPGACHLFRHTMATLMLENGADIRYIQAILGHADLSTTQIYTQVSIAKLKAVHAMTHPGASHAKRRVQTASPAQADTRALSDPRLSADPPI